MNLSMIAAIGRNGELGKNNALLWRLEGDLPFFKRVTMGKTVVMGRRTYESMGRALPGRRNIVITRDRSFSAPDVETAPSPMAALDMCISDEEVFVIGGGGSGIPVYRALQRAGVPFAAGILPESDLDYPVAKALAAKLYSVPAFSTPRDTDAHAAKAAMLKTQRVVCTVPAFGETNAANQSLYEAARSAGILTCVDALFKEVEA